MADDSLIKMLIDSNDKLNVSVAGLNDKFGSFVEIEAARSEREKFQQKEIETLQLFKEEAMPTIIRSKRYHGFMDASASKLLTALVIIILMSAGVITIPKMLAKQSTEIPSSK